MAKNNNLTDFVTDLADGFREKLGWETTDKINPQDFRDFIEHSPSVGTLTTGLESLNWTKTLQNGVNVDIDAPNELELSIYFDTETGTQLLPLIQFTIRLLDNLTGDGEVRVYDAMTDASIGRLTTIGSEAKYILPVFANLSTGAKYAVFPTFGMIATDVPASGVRVQLSSSLVQIGSPVYPMILSGATMRGYK